MTDMQPRRDGDRPAAEQLRIGTVEREAVVERLQAALGEGRLDMHEFDDRVAQVYTARAADGLLPLTADLPVSHSAPRPAPSPQARPAAGPSAGSTGSRPELACPGVGVASLGNGGVGQPHRLGPGRPPTGDPPYFWPMWVAGPWGAVLLVGTLFRSAQLAGSRPRAAVLVLSAGLW